MINKQDKQISKYLKDCGIPYSVILLQIDHDQDGWKCDKWLCRFGSEDFDYHTGTGHRIPKRVSTFAVKEQKQLKELRAVLGMDRLSELVKQTKEQVRNPDGLYHSMYTCPPTQASVLYGLLLDMSAEGESFKNWCANYGYDYGYDEDSRKAEKIYFACQEIADKMRRVFTSKQIEDMQEILQDY